MTKGELKTSEFLENSVHFVQVQSLVQYAIQAPGKIALVLRGQKYGLKASVILTPSQAEKLGQMLSQAAKECKNNIQ